MSYEWPSLSSSHCLIVSSSHFSLKYFLLLFEEGKAFQEKRVPLYGVANYDQVGACIQGCRCFFDRIDTTAYDEGNIDRLAHRPDHVGRDRPQGAAAGIQEDGLQTEHFAGHSRTHSDIRLICRD